MMDLFEGDSSFCLAVVSPIVIGSFDYGWGLPAFIRMLLLALKYMEGSLFRFPFYCGDVLKVASTTAASLAKILGDFSFCCSVSILPVESPVSTVFRLPVETIFGLPVEIVFRLPVETSLAYLVGWGSPLFGLFQSSLLYSAIFFPWVFVPLFLPQF